MASTTKTDFTFNPALGVYLVIKLNPIILSAASSTSYSVFTITTPPVLTPDVNLPFPLPPAWTMAFTTKPYELSSLEEIILASQGVEATDPFYTLIL